jgi:hypothetical protein
MKVATNAYITTGTTIALQRFRAVRVKETRRFN